MEFSLYFCEDIDQPRWNISTMCRWTSMGSSKTCPKSGSICSCHIITWTKARPRWLRPCCRVWWSSSCCLVNNSSRWSRMCTSSRRILRVSLLFRSSWVRAQCVRCSLPLTRRNRIGVFMLVGLSSWRMTAPSIRLKLRLLSWIYVTPTISPGISSPTTIVSRCLCSWSLWMEEPWLTLYTTTYAKYHRTL